MSRGSCADSGDSEAFLLTIPERTRRLIKSEQRLKIRSKRGVETTDSERCDFVFYSEFDRKLLKFRHEGSGKIFFFRFPKNRSCSVILDFLKADKLFKWQNQQWQNDSSQDGPG